LNNHKKAASSAAFFIETIKDNPIQLYHS